MGPSIVQRLSARTDEQLAQLVRQGLPDAGMPGQTLPDTESAALLKFLRGIERKPGGGTLRTFRTTDGRDIEGLVVAEGFDDLQVRTADQRVHLFRRAGQQVREVGSGASWALPPGRRTPD